ncbi:MAG: hypothetical protein E7675_04990 [Ruminococcaceae bacterium]|nr:hypothetical protein [Oscillospiraceae bacterium]
MSENPLKYINGKKIRTQYFNSLIYSNLFLMSSVPLLMLLIDIQEHKFVFSNWLSNVFICFGVMLILSFPLILLSILNRHCFGRIVCVLDDKGIHYREGFIKWEDINSIEYFISNQRRYSYDPFRSCRAVIYTDKGSISLLHSPFYILASIKKIKPNIPSGMSRSSKFRIIFLAILLYVFVVIFPIILQ